MRVVLVVCLVVVAGCAVWDAPDVPSNAAIQLMGAFHQQDQDEAASLICDSTPTSAIDFENPESLGALQALYEAQIGASARGGNTQFTAQEELELTVPAAWSEIELVDEGSTEIWRLQLMLENDSWKVCTAELRE